MMEATDIEARQLRYQVHRFGQRQPACLALADAHCGIGLLIAAVVWSELDDCRRFSRCPPHRARSHHGCFRSAAQLGLLVSPGPPDVAAPVRSGLAVSKTTSPRQNYYQSVKAAHGGKLVAISMARKLARRCCHTLHNLDPVEVYAHQLAAIT